MFNFGQFYLLLLISSLKPSFFLAGILWLSGYTKLFFAFQLEEGRGGNGINTQIFCVPVHVCVWWKWLLIGFWGVVTHSDH